MSELKEELKEKFQDSLKEWFKGVEHDIIHEIERTVSALYVVYVHGGEITEDKIEFVYLWEDSFNNTVRLSVDSEVHLDIENRQKRKEIRFAEIIQTAFDVFERRL